MASHGYLWIGTSEGCMLVYHIPHLDTIPIVSGKPYLAMDSHRGDVRVLLPIHTGGTVESTRVKQFEDDEDHRRSMLLGKEEMMGLSRVLKEGLDSQSRAVRSMSEPLEMFCNAERPETLMMKNDVPSSSHPYANTADHTSSSSTVYVNTTTPAADVRIEQAISPNPLAFLRSGAIEVGKAEPAQETLSKAAAGQEMEEHENNTTMEKLDEEVDGNVKKGDVRMEEEQEHLKEETVEKKEEEESRQKEGAREMEKDERNDWIEDDEDYNSDELASMARFKNGIHSSPATQNRDTFINGEEFPSQLQLHPVSLDSLRDSGDYTVPLELDSIRNSAIAERYRNGNPVAEVTAVERCSTHCKQDSVNSEEQGNSASGKEGAYNDPVELDIRRRLSTLEVARRANGLREDDGSYEFPSELARSLLSDTVHPYEDPATLGKDITAPLSSLYSTKTLNKSLLYFQPRRNIGEEGGMFVLTAGKGIRNLRFGRKAPIFNLANKEAQCCMIAYEVEV